MMLINFNYDLKKYKLKKYHDLLISIANRVYKELKLKNTIIFDCSFVTKRKIKKINFKYRNKNYVTDVISFALWDNNIHKTNLLGELYICYHKIIKQAHEYKHSFKRELCFLFLHGLLHLLGYDHIKKEDEEIMFALQDKILNELGILR